MLLRSGTIVSNISQASSSTEETRNKRESVPLSQAIEPILMPVNTSGMNSLPNNTNVNHTPSTWPMYSLPPGYILPIATQGMVGPFPNMYNNPIYQNAQYANAIIANMPINLWGANQPI